MARERKPGVDHDFCLILDVATLARSGLFAPGHRDGSAELLGVAGRDLAVEVAIGAVFGADRGELCLDWPAPARVAVVSVPTPIGPRWRLVCPDCERRVRRLYVPETPAGEAGRFACRHCWGVSYADGRRGRRRGRGDRLRAALEEVAALAGTLADLEAALALARADLEEAERELARARAAAAEAEARGRGVT